MNTLDPRILIIRPDAMGDVILMIPLLNTIKATWPQAELYPLLQGYTQDILTNHPSVTQVILDRKKAGQVKTIKAFFAYVAYIKSFKFDIAILPFLEDFYLFLCVFAGIPVRVGDQNKPLIRPFLTHSIPLVFRDLSMHETEQQAKLFQALVPNPHWDMRMNLALNPQEKPYIEALLKTQGWNQERLIGIHTSTGGGNRAWTPSQFALLINLVHAQTAYSVVLTGASPKECEKIQAIIQLCDRKPLNVSGKTSTSQLKTLISLCDAFLGTDTGPVHVAAALQKPVVGLSPTKYIKSLRWGPWQTPHRVVGHPQSCAVVCNPFKCQLPDCLDAISAQEVFDLLKDLLNNPQIQAGEEDRRRWFKASVTLCFYVSDLSQLSVLNRYRSLLGSGYVLTNSEDVQRALGSKSCHLISPWQLKKMIRFITEKDITVLHLLDPLLRGPWTLIRQLSALKLYAPPIKVQFTDPYESESALVDRYLKEFHYD